MRRGIVRALAFWTFLNLAAGAASAAPPGSPWGAAYFPNVPLVAHDGTKVRFYDDLVRDKIVVISFMFTRCGLACPLIVANLARVQDLLGDRVGKDVFLYSITIDPENDTPAVLREYADAFDAGPGWLFLTGTPEDIETLRAKFGDRNSVQDHAPQLQIGNDAIGQWVRKSAIGDPESVASAIGDWMDPGRNDPGTRPGSRDASSPPAQRNPAVE